MKIVCEDWEKHMVNNCKKCTQLAADLHKVAMERDEYIQRLIDAQNIIIERNTTLLQIQEVIKESK